MNVSDCHVWRRLACQLLLDLGVVPNRKLLDLLHAVGNLEEGLIRNGPVTHLFDVVIYVPLNRKPHIVHYRGDVTTQPRPGFRIDHDPAGSARHGGHLSGPALAKPRFDWHVHYDTGMVLSSKSARPALHFFCFTPVEPVLKRGWQPLIFAARLLLAGVFGAPGFKCK